MHISDTLTRDSSINAESLRMNRADHAKKGIAKLQGAGHQTGVTKAFLLGAGLGTRLQPLMHRLPKPLVPLGHQALNKHAWQAAWRWAAMTLP